MRTIDTARALEQAGMECRTAEIVAGAIEDARGDRPDTTFLRWALGLIVAVSIASPVWLSGRVDAIGDRVDENTERLVRVEERLGGVEDRLGAVEGRLGAVEERLREMNGKLDRLIADR